MDGYEPTPYKKPAKPAKRAKSDHEHLYVCDLIVLSYTSPVKSYRTNVRCLLCGHQRRATRKSRANAEIVKEIVYNDKDSFVRGL